MKHTKTTSFKVGTVVATPGVLAALQEGTESFLVYLIRQASGNWNKMPGADRKEEPPIERDHPMVTSFTLHNGTRLLVMTEADRSSTTILLTAEY